MTHNFLRRFLKASEEKGRTMLDDEDLWENS